MSTNYPKKYNRKENEQKWKDYWKKNSTYKFTFDKNKPTYVVDTPPPYVSADHLHSGHIMSYSQAEFVVRYKRMNGFNAFYPMGFDDNGYPTERFVEKKYNVDKNTISKKEFVDLCLQETAKGAENYKKLWNNLGISVDWTKTYSTISPPVVKQSQIAMKKMFDKGVLYQKESPILWGVKSQTALAQTDLEDKEFTKKLNYLNFKSTDGDDLTIATTRPELLPACVALYANPTDKRYAHLKGKKAIAPIFEQEVEIRFIEDVDPEFGTGLMMVCTWGDQEDVKKWQIDNLPTREVLNKDGTLNDLAGEYAGLYFEDAREKIIERLKTDGHMVKQEELTHTVKVNDRTGVPVNFIKSKQWFVNLVDNKDVWIKQGKKINWYPKDRFNDYKNWVESVKWDWCISRQRYYGVPIPVWFDKQTGEPYFVGEEHLPHDPTQDECPFASQYPDKEFVPEMDVADTWVTSSSTPFMLGENFGEGQEYKNEMFPVSLRPNAFEIIRTWDFYSIVNAYYTQDGAIPFKDVMISGHGLDAEGRKISKRLGNYVPSDDLMEMYGADAIRYWATGAKLGGNLRFSEEEINKGEKLAIKLWNVGRFLSMHIPTDGEGENAKLNISTVDNFNKTILEESDKWIIDKCNQTIKQVTKAFDNYNYSKARDLLEEFFWYTFADYYIEFIKYRLFGDDEKSKNAAVTTAYNVYRAIVKMYAPILPFITEEISSQLKFIEDESSLHLSSWPTELKEVIVDEDFESVVSAIDDIRKAKTEQGVSVGKEVESVEISTKVNLQKYQEFLQKVGRVEKIHLK